MTRSRSKIFELDTLRPRFFVASWSSQRDLDTPPGDMSLTFVELGDRFKKAAKQVGLSVTEVSVGSEVRLRSENDLESIYEETGVDATPIDVMPNGAWCVTFAGDDLTLTVFLPPELRSRFVEAARSENFTAHPTATGFTLNMAHGVGVYFRHGQQICEKAGFVAPIWEEWQRSVRQVVRWRDYFAGDAAGDTAGTTGESNGVPMILSFFTVKNGLCGPPVSPNRGGDVCGRSRHRFRDDIV